MMTYWLRVVLGIVLGLLALVPLALFVGVTWMTALAAALLAPLGFLLTYFIWSADRPEEGYEQVLFDKPNTLVTSLLLVAFALAGVGSGFLPPGGSGAPDPADGVAALRADYQAASDAYTSGEADAEATSARMAELRTESDRLAIELEALPEGEARDALVAANDALAFATDHLTACIEGDQAQCVEARLAAADAQSALRRYAEMG